MITLPASGCAIHLAWASDGAAAPSAGQIAAVTRAAYACSDPLPGLPAPDGASDTPAMVERELAEGALALVARDPSGRPAGALRVVEHVDGSWQLQRVSVLPAWRRRGLGRALLAAVEAAAAERGVRRLWLDAVIERCLPPLYAHLGWRVVRHWPSEDKPMTEATIERRPSARHGALAYPWEADPAGDAGLLVCWLLDGGELLAVADVVAGDVIGHVRERSARLAAALGHRLRLAGADLWRGAGDTDLARVLAALTALAAERRGAGGGAALRFAAGRADVRPHLLPRTLDPRLLALWRLAPGREPALADVPAAVPLPAGAPR
jgi:GNAT superfamily N-acetyltransferase